jgi:hypothetical protein
MGFEPDGRIRKVDPLAPLLEALAAPASSSEAPLPIADPL